MKQGTSKALILIVMLASTIAAMVLRQMQLIRVFDAVGWLGQMVFLVLDP